MSSGIDKKYDMIHSTEGTEWHKFAKPVDIIGEDVFRLYRAPIREVPVCASVPSLVEGMPDETVILPNHKTLILDYRGIREDLEGADALVPLHIPKSAYRPVTNGEVIDMMNAALAEVLASPT